MSSLARPTTTPMASTSRAPSNPLSGLSVTPGQSSFEALPAEIRLRIYGFLLAAYELDSGSGHFEFRADRKTQYLSLEQLEQEKSGGVVDLPVSAPPFLRFVFHKDSVGRGLSHEEKRLFELTRLCKSVRADLVPLIGSKLHLRIRDIYDTCWFTVTSRSWASHIKNLTIEYFSLQSSHRLRWMSQILERLPELVFLRCRVLLDSPYNQGETQLKCVGEELLMVRYILQNRRSPSQVSIGVKLIPARDTLNSDL